MLEKWCTEVTPELQEYLLAMNVSSLETGEKIKRSEGDFDLRDWALKEKFDNSKSKTERIYWNLINISRKNLYKNSLKKKVYMAMTLISVPDMKNFTISTDGTI